MRSGILTITVFLLVGVAGCKKSILDFPRAGGPEKVDFKAVQKKYEERQGPSAKVKKEIISMVDESMRLLNEGHDILEAVAIIPHEERTISNTLDAGDNFYNLMELAMNWPGFYAYVHPDPYIRQAGENIDKLISKYLVDVGSSKVLYQSLSDLREVVKNPSEVDAYILDEWIRDFEDSGVALSDKQREEYKNYSKELTDLGIEFSKNIREYSDHVLVSKEALKGMDEDYISRLKKANDKFMITMDYPSILPYLDFGEDESVRKDLLTKFRRRAGEKNLVILNKILAIRVKVAALLGHPSHAHYIVARRMAKKPETAKAFLSDLLKRVSIKAKKEYESMKILKRKLSSDPNSVPEQWDKSFLAKKMVKEKYSYDPQQVKEYFEGGRVIDNVLRTYQKIYELSFKELSDKTWHADVRHFEVLLKNKKIGEFYLDLYPRPNKYKHAAAWGIRPHKAKWKGEEQLPISALVMNIPKKTEDRSSLLSLDDVETLYHEFGHIMHGVLSTTRFASVSGTRTMRDFVEAPSQIFEKWAYNEKLLSEFGLHYKTGKPIPRSLVGRINKSRVIISGIDTQRQIFYGTYDLTLHSESDAGDPLELWISLKNKSEYFKAVEGTLGPASFGHLLGYSAGYYGYLWSRMLAMDMYEHFRDHGGLLNPKEGARFRDIVLSRGGTVHPTTLVEEFLGRPAKIDALLRDLGVEGKN